MKYLLSLVAGYLGAVGLVILWSMWSTLLWFCFCDELARVAGAPALASLNWFTVWTATLFIQSLLKIRVTASLKSIV